MLTLAMFIGIGITIVRGGKAKPGSAGAPAGSTLVDRAGNFVIDRAANNVVSR